MLFYYITLDFHFRLSKFVVKGDWDWKQNGNRNSLTYLLLRGIWVCMDCSRDVCIPVILGIYLQILNIKIRFWYQGSITDLLNLILWCRAYVCILKQNKTKALPSGFYYRLWWRILWLRKLIIALWNVYHHN